MSEARNPTEGVQANSNTDLNAVLRERLKASLSTDLGAEQVDYCCSACSERCINPRGSVLHEAGTCLDCHVEYATTGRVRGRIFARWD